ncbi:MAG: DUF4091 domain-containing protein [Candidatus Helarchaeota archaeon]|nr:DUF4091 domain-containing protein [Candidatus Helarchaeota archaeon]
MEKLRYFLYEIVSVSMGLAILAFFGTLSFLPMEIMLWGEGQTAYWTLIILVFSAVIAFTLLSFCKKKYHAILMRMADVATVIFAILLINSYLVFTQDLFEPWIIQAAWFFRYNGLFIGLFLGCMMVKTITGLSYLITKVNNSNNLNETSQKSAKESNSNIIAFSIIAISFTIYSAEMLFFRYSSLFMTLLAIFIIESSLIVYSVLILLNTSHYNHLRFQVYESDIELPKTNVAAGELSEGKDIKNVEALESGKLARISSKVRKAGSDPSTFWYLFIPLLVVFIWGVVTAILYPYNIILNFTFTLGVNTIFYPMPLVQVLSLFMILILIFIVAFNAWGGRMNRRLGKYYDSRLKKAFAVSGFGAIDAMRFMGLFLVISQILYFFEYPIYLPRVISFYLMFGVLGAFIYFIAGRKSYLKKILYICAVLLLIWNFNLTYIDGITNGIDWSALWGGTYEITFPFLYLHSWRNFMMVGIPTGIIFTDLLYNLGFTHTDGKDAPNRAVFLGVVPFVLAMLTMPGNYLVSNPGAESTPSFDPFFYYFCLILNVLLIIGLAFNYLVTEILIPVFIEKKSIIKIKKKGNPSSTNPGSSNQKPRKNTGKGPPPRKKFLALAIAGIMVLTFVGGVGIYATHSQTYNRPIICYNSGNYYVWVQDSSERVSKNVKIAESSPRIDAVELYLAKNEYGAVQLVWYPHQPVQSLTYNISDFHHQNGSYTIEASNCTLRYVDFVIEDEFPDILRPFTVRNLELKENNIFWFAIKTPYEVVEGLYRGNVTFTFDGGQEIVNVDVNVWNFTIPHMRHLRTNIGGRSRDFERIDNYLYHRINDYGVSISKANTLTQLNTQEVYTCWLDTSTNTWTFNWTWWDTMIQYKLDRGMNGFVIQCPLGMGRDPPIEDATWMLRLKNWLVDVANHFEPLGWLNYSYYYFIDEFQMFIPDGYTREEYFDRLEILLHEMKNATTKIKIMTTTPPSAELEDLYDYIDIYCPISNDRDKARWDERLAADCEFWFYSCVGPMAPWPNAHLYNRLYEIRIELWQVWLYNIHGFLFWSSTAYYHGDYGLAFNGWGDGWFIWEFGGILYDSIRWENFLEGQEDYEYLWLLNATLQYLTENPGVIPANELSSYKAEFDTIVNSVVGEKWVYCDHVSTLYSGRDRIGAILNDLGSVVNLTALGEAQWFPPYKPGA